jgi:hypothetical protein
MTSEAVGQLPVNGDSTSIRPPSSPNPIRNIEGAISASSPASAFTLLFPGGGRALAHDEVRTPPSYFPDLNLDQLVAAITATREPYDLVPFFYEHLEDVDTISYRQEVFKDLERSEVIETVCTFAQQMRDMRASFEQTKELRYQRQKEAWFVDTVDLYCRAVATLASGLDGVELSSRGLLELREYVNGYVAAPAFQAFEPDIATVRKGLAGVKYLIRIRGLRCTVSRYEGEADYGATVLSTFDRFKQGAVKDYRVGFRNPPELNHVEAKVLDLVALLYPAEFAVLAEFWTQHLDYFDSTIRRFEREVQFYLAILEHLRPLRAAGLSFCYPEMSRESKEVFAEETFDLALADKLVAEQRPVVCNDFFLTGQERILVISGPNQGGKTTFARMFGELHHLAGIGCPVPGRSARLYHFDQIFTQFEREEDLSNMTGKLEDDLVRIGEILAQATSDSVLVLNEIFASTTLHDALFLGRKVMERLIELDLLAVFVTFVDELASLAPSTVSMVSTVAADNPAERTFKVLRRPADGLAYALAVAEKYGLTYSTLKRRIAR